MSPDTKTTAQHPRAPHWFSRARHLYRRVVYSRTVRRLRSLFGGEDASMLALAAVVGIVTGLGSLAFREMVSIVSELSFGGESVLESAPLVPWYLRLVLPAIGLVGAWALTRYFAPEARGHGVPEVMEAVSEGGKIRPQVAIVKSLASCLTIGTGGSVGREGPIVQIGSAFGSVAGQLLHLSEQRLRLLVACGAAAGIGATFNAPMSGVIFAVEIILGSAAVRTFSPIVVASVMATAISRHFLGEGQAFASLPYSLISAAELLDYVVLGLLAGAIGVAFTHMLYALEDFLEDLPMPAVLLPILAGLTVGALGLMVPDVYGLGYETIEKALVGGLPLKLLALLIAAKMIATSVTLGGGGSGGVFAPSLFLGAMIGGVVGVAAGQLAPWPTAASGAYALVGMGAVVAATTRAPLTAIIIIFELTNDYEIILPLMLSVIIAVSLSAALQRENIYTMKLIRRGVHLHRGSTVDEVLTTSVSDLCREATAMLRPQLALRDVVEQLMTAPEQNHYVVDADGQLLGVVRFNDVKRIELDEHDERTAVDVMVDCPFLEEDDRVERCISELDRLDLHELPVLDPDGRLKGLMWRRDILSLYSRELQKTDHLGAMFVSHDEDKERRDYVELPFGHAVEAVEVPREFVGKTLRDLDLRRHHHLLVIGVRRREDDVAVKDVPDPARRLEPGEILIVEGPESEIEWLRLL